MAALTDRAVLIAGATSASGRAAATAAAIAALSRMSASVTAKSRFDSRRTRASAPTSAR